MVAAEFAEALGDPDLAVAIYEAAYGYEDPDGTTPVRLGDSQILGLTSNRRQNYQSAWYALSEALPALLRCFVYIRERHQQRSPAPQRVHA